VIFFGCCAARGSIRLICVPFPFVGGGGEWNLGRKEKRMRKVDTFAPHNDGHQWRKYGEKKINNTNFPRSGPDDHPSIFSAHGFVLVSFWEKKVPCICVCSGKSTLTGKESTFISQPSLTFAHIHRIRTSHTVAYRQISRNV
jgi:hypothetical protein